MSTNEVICNFSTIWHAFICIKILPGVRRFNFNYGYTASSDGPNNYR